MDNKIIGETVSTTFPVPTKISDLVDDMHIEETNKSVKVLLDTTELKMNKVDAFVDAEDESKAYPSVFGVKAYGEDLKAQIGEKYDYQLDNKVDKTEFEDYKESALATHDILYDCKLDKTEFEEYREGALATHDILYDCKLDRGWTEVGRDEITQADIENIKNVGDIAVKVLTAAFEKDITSCVELMTIIRIPVSENTTTANWKAGLLTPVENEPHYGSGWLTTGFGGQSISPKDANGSPSVNEVMVRSYFLNGVHIYTQSVVSTTAYLKIAVHETIPRIYEGAMGNIYKPAKLTDKDAYYFQISGDFKLPLGTTMTVYGR